MEASHLLHAHQRLMIPLLDTTGFPSRTCTHHPLGLAYRACHGWYLPRHPPGFSKERHSDSFPLCPLPSGLWLRLCSTTLDHYATVGQWGKVVPPTFTASIIQGSDLVLRGKSNWRSYGIPFELLTNSCSLIGSLYGRVQIPTDPSLLTDFNHVSATHFNAFHHPYDKTIQLEVEKFLSTLYSSP